MLDGRLEARVRHDDVARGRVQKLERRVERLEARGPVSQDATAPGLDVVATELLERLGQDVA